MTTFHLTLDDRVAQRQSQTTKRTDSMGWSGNRRADGFGVMATLGTSTYIYDTLGNPAFPAAPYSMEDPNAIGPMIADRPSQITTDGQGASQSSDRLSNRSSDMAASSVDLSVDAQTFMFQLGPRLHWNTEKGFALFVQPAFTANLLDVSVDRLETFRRSNGTVVSSWRDSNNTYKWKMGAGVQAGVQVPVSENWRLSASGGYEWIDKFSLSVGPDQVHMDLSGYQVELAVGRSF